MAIASGFTALNYASNAARKVFGRVERPFRDERRYREWLTKHETSFEQWSQERSPDLSREAVDFETELYRFAHTQHFPSHMGGNAFVRLLYFVTRYLRPETAVETGVSIGYSSQAILQAMELNGMGKLYSSELQYFRDRESSNFVGLLVNPELKPRWTLMMEGDRINLMNIVKNTPRINFFHYDSDKSISGRTFACKLIMNKMSKGDVVILDDVNDNDHLLSLSNSLGLIPTVFKTNHKSVALFVV